MVRLTLLACLIAAPSPAAAQGQRLYVGIGVNEYHHAQLRPLDFADADVTETGQELARAGYQTVLLTTAAGKADRAKAPTLANVTQALDVALAGRGRGDVVVIGFAGHGVQFGDDPDVYFCPHDAVPFPEDKATLVSLGGLYRRLERCGASAKVLLADCCRNDPNPGRGRSSGEVMDKPPPRGVMALFACGKDEQAHEFPAIKHGVFFHHVLEGLRGKGANPDGDVEFELLAAHVRREVPKTVKRLSDGRSRPQNPNQKAADVTGEPLVLVPSATEAELWRDIAEFTAHMTRGGTSLDFVKTRGEKRAVAWKMAAERGNVVPVCMFATCVFFGMGADKNPTEAVRRFRKAADLGYPPAMDILGNCYYHGSVVDKDPAEAVRWYRKAAELDYPPAMFSLGYCYDDGAGVDKDPAEAVRWYRKAAELDYPPAMNNLGACYENGDGVDKDLTEAVRWYRKAADSGHERAKKNLKRLGKE